MFIVWGKTRAGKVDQVADLFHVATNFGHLYWLPLLPLGSVAVSKSENGQELEIPLPLSMKSVLVGWLRGGCVAGLVLAAVMLVTALGDQPRRRLKPHHWPIPASVMAVCGVTLLVSYRLRFLREASYERARELAGHLELTDLAQLLIEVHYGRMTAAEADEELARRDALQLAGGVADGIE